MNFAVHADHKIKQKKDRQILEPAREQKKVWTMKMTIEVCALGTVPKYL